MRLKTGCRPQKRRKRPEKGGEQCAGPSKTAGIALSERCGPCSTHKSELFRASLADSMAKNDHELVQNMTRVQISEKQVIVEVAVIDWPHPHEPRISWVLASTLPLSSTSTSIDAARSKLMNNRNFFALCEECGERKSKGHMFSGKICMSCAERNHGVVY